MALRSYGLGAPRRVLSPFGLTQFDAALSKNSAFIRKNRAAFMQARARILQARRSRAGRVITKFAKNILAKRKARRDIGEKVGTSTCKRVLVQQVVRQLQPTYTLHVRHLTEIPTKLVPTDIQYRERQIANVRGFKIYLSCSNQTDDPIYFNWAIIAPKQGGDPMLEGEFTAMPNFFRGFTTDRSINFADANMEDINYHLNPLNTDRFSILLHQRHILAPRFAAGRHANGARQSFIVRDKWVPLKRQVRFQSSTNPTPETGDVYLVWWAAKFNATSVAELSQTQMSLNVITYYREPKN